jgi:hypothetical protein
MVAFTAMGANPEDYLSCGFCDLLSKPFTKKDVFAVLRKWTRPDTGPQARS